MLTTARHYLLPALLASLAALTGGCKDRATLNIIIEHPAVFDPALQTGTYTLALVEPLRDEVIISADDLPVENLKNMPQAFEALALEKGQAYRLAIVFSFGPGSGCSDGTAVGLSPPFEYGSSLGQVSLYVDCADRSSETASLETHRILHTATWVPTSDPWGRVLVTGGANLEFAADIVSGTYDNSEIYGAVESYDPARGTFTTLESNFAPRAYHSAVGQPDGTVLIAGGVKLQQVGATRTPLALDIVERLSSDGSLTRLGNLETPRYGHSALASEGRMALAYGVGTQGVRNDIEFYNTGSGTGITKVASDGEPRFDAATVSFGGEIGLVIGGLYRIVADVPNQLLCGGDDCGCTGPCTVTLTPGFGPGLGRSGMTATFVSCDDNSGKGAVYAVGGRNTKPTPDYYADIFCYDVPESGLVSGAPQPVGQLQRARAMHTTTAVRGPNGKTRLFVAGGLIDGGTSNAVPINDAELIAVSCSCSAITAADKETIDLQQFRALHTATALPDGSVLLIGGLLDGPAERFVPNLFP